MPSTFYVHEGPELRIRAARDLSPEDELSINWFSQSCQTTYTAKKYWGTFCICTFCATGQLVGLPPGSLRDAIVKLVELPTTGIAYRMKGLEDAVSDMLAAGFSWGTYPMRELHEDCIRSYLSQRPPTNNNSERLKLVLKIRYLIEPSQEPPQYLPLRVATLRLLQAHLGPLENDPYDGPFHPEIAELVKHVKLHHRDILARETARIFGEDSKVARFEKAAAEDEAATYNRAVYAKRKEEGEWKYVPLSESEDAKLEFMKNMNELLKWAGVPAMEAKDFLPKDLLPKDLL